MKKYADHVYAGEIIATREIDGITYTARVELDDNSTPDDFEENPVEYAEPWHRDGWHCFGIVVSGDRDGWTKDYLESLFGIDCAEREHYVGQMANKLIDSAAAGGKTAEGGTGNKIMKFYAANNQYGSDTDIGFSNTWYALAFSSKNARDTYVASNRSLAARKITRKELSRYIQGVPKPFSGERYALVSSEECISGCLGQIAVTHPDAPHYGGEI